MLIRSLFIENFRQYSGSHLLDLSIDWGSSQNLIVIEGSNGAGKTTLMEALRLALFGKLNDDLWRESTYKNYIRNCINRGSLSSGNREFSLAAELEVGGLKEYSTLKIERHWRLDSDFEAVHETVRLFGNGKERIGMSAEEAELFITEAIPYGISRFVFFDGEKIHDLARQIDGAQIRDAVASVLGLSIYQELRRDLLAYERHMIRENCDDGELKAAMQVVDKTNEALGILKSRKAATLSDLSLAEAELGEVRNERKRLGSQELMQHSEVETQISLLREERNQVQRRISEMLSDNLPMVILQPLLIEMKRQLGTEVDGEQRQLLQALIEDRKTRLRRALRKLGFEETLFDAAWSEVFPDGQTKVCIKHRHLANDQKRIFIDRIEGLQRRSLNRVGEPVKELERIDHKMRRLLSSKRSMPTDQVYLDLEDREKAALEAVRTLSQELGAISVEENRLNHELGAARRTEEGARRRLMLAAEVEKRLVKVQSLVSGLTLFIDRFAAARATDLRSHLSSMFQQLAEKEMVFEFDVDPETFTITAVDMSGNKLEVQSFSEGEKEVFALSFIWALSKIAVEELPIVIDTPFGRLDSFHRHHIGTRFLPVANRQTIVLSTDTEIDSSMFDSLRPNVCKVFTLEYQKEDRSTVIVLGRRQVEVTEDVS